MAGLKVRQEVYDTYWYFAAKRQNIFFKKLRGNVRPYTDDPLLDKYKFCNAYRASDRVSQFLIKNVIYSQNLKGKETLFRIFLFRLLNKIETWQELDRHFGEINLDTFSFKEYDRFLTAINEERSIYGNAFILCANKAFGYDRKHQNHLALLEHVFVKSETSETLLDSPSLERLFKELKKLPLIGNFMAYQLAVDFNYSEVYDFDENDFTVAGPGALRGIKKCFKAMGNYSPADIINYMVDNQEREFKRLGLDFQRIGDRPLHAIDCQGLFCETDKYSRVRFPELKSNRSRIKAEYTPRKEKIDYFYPPKWGVQLRTRDV